MHAGCCGRSSYPLSLPKLATRVLLSWSCRDSERGISERNAQFRFWNAPSLVLVKSLTILILCSLILPHRLIPQLQLTLQLLLICSSSLLYTPFPAMSHDANAQVDETTVVITHSHSRTFLEDHQADAGTTCPGGRSSHSVWMLWRILHIQGVTV